MVALAGWGIVEMLPPDHPYAGSWHADADRSTLLDVHTQGMGVTLHAGNTSRVEVTADGGYDDQAPEFSMTASGQTIAVVGTCAGGCSVQLHITLPAALAATVETGGPAISAAGLSGRLDLHTTSGAIDVDNTSGPLTLRSDDGAVTLSGSRSPSAKVTTGDGAVDATFSSAPATVDIKTHDGAVDLRLPKDAGYSIDAHSSGSTPEVALPTDRNASHAIDVETRGGGLKVH
ncbi:DUF4097 family beta strand repeat-containing protein [Streptomyces sp. NPDC048416]|uniref:DUF4097 family beta strand repeat-containing protein n=1 Tax=Streptomyces sp. NPDC048416 TaxID=3365546 RepID=UPI00371C2D53